MRVETVYEALEKYVQERLINTQDQARTRFLAYVHMKFRGDELRVFMHKAGGVSRYQIHLLNVLLNPLKRPEGAWLFSLIILAVFGCFLMYNADTRTGGIFLFSGATVNIGSIISSIQKKSRETKVLMAIYDELLQLTEEEEAAQS